MALPRAGACVVRAIAFGLVLWASSGAAAQMTVVRHVDDGPHIARTVGRALANAGDVDGDGFADFVIGFESTGVSALTVPSAPVEVCSGVTGTVIVTLMPPPSATLGWARAVAGIGDLDGDGVPDIAIGDTNVSGAGAVFLFSGATGLLLRSIFGNLTVASGGFGSAIAGLGDVDDDGVPEILIGAPGTAPNAFGLGGFGAAAVVSGATGTAIRIHTGTVTGMGFGTAVCAIGDVSGDGIADFAVGQPGPEPLPTVSPPGVVFVFDGASGAGLGLLAGVPLEHYGNVLSAAGDLDGDGSPDLAIGAPSAPAPAMASQGNGRIEVRSIASGAVLLAYAGPIAGGACGRSLAGIGDLDADGVPDLAVGIPGNGGAVSGIVHLVSGMNASLIRTFTGSVDPWMTGSALCALGDVDGDGAPDFAAGDVLARDGGMVYGVSGATAAVIHRSCGDGFVNHFGSAVAATGDFDADGTPDFLVGSAGANNRQNPDAGEVRVISGATGAPLRIIIGLVSFGGLGWSVARGADLDGDAVPDIVAGAPAAGPIGGIGAGSVRAYSGATGAALWFNAGVPGDKLGYSVARIGDVDADGVADFAAGAPAASGGAGTVLVFSGSTGTTLFAISGTAIDVAFGASVAGIGDLDDDGIPDILVGAPDSLIPSSPGQVFCCAGAGGASPGVVRALSGATGAQISAVAGTAAGEGFGHAVAEVGDVDGDGIPEFAVGAPWRNVPVQPFPCQSACGGGSAGRVSLVSGGSGTTILTVNGTSPAGAAGWTVAAAGDVNADGVPDFSLGAPLAYGLPAFPGAATSQVGQVEIRSGANGALLLAHDGLPNSTTAGPERFGTALASIGDVNGDGMPELVCGAPAALPPAGDSGKSRGRATVLSPVFATPAISFFGTGCAAPGATAIPMISVGSMPFPGNATFRVVMDCSPPSPPLASPALLAAGLSNTSWMGVPLPLSLTPAGLPGCSLLVSPDFVFQTTTVIPHPLFCNATVNLPIPPIPSLSGAVFFFQWAVAAPSAGPGAASFSRGMRVVIQ